MHTHKTMFLQTQETITKISLQGSAERTHQVRALVPKPGDFCPWDSRGGQKETIAASWPLTFTHMPRHAFPKQSLNR